jgi:hypothetical protein
MAKLDRNQSKARYEVVESSARRGQAAQRKSCLRKLSRKVEGERFTRKEARASRPSVGPPWPIGGMAPLKFHVAKSTKAHTCRHPRELLQSRHLDFHHEAQSWRPREARV